MAKYGDVREALAQQEMEEARELLREYLESDTDSAEVWYLASQAAVNEKQKRYFLEKAVECDPLHAAAGLALHALMNDKEIPTPKVTPEKQTQQSAKPILTPAPIFNRAFALLIDFVVLALFSFLTFSIASLLTGAIDSSGALSQFYLVWMILNSVLYIAYFGHCYTARNGQTIGKQVMGVRVVKQNGKPLTWADAFLRCWVGYTLSLAPFGLGFIWAFFDNEKQAWHDIITETRVVKA